MLNKPKFNCQRYEFIVSHAIPELELHEDDDEVKDNDEVAVAFAHMQIS